MTKNAPLRPTAPEAPAPSPRRQTHEVTGSHQGNPLNSLRRQSHRGQGCRPLSPKPPLAGPHAARSAAASSGARAPRALPAAAPSRNSPKLGHASRGAGCPPRGEQRAWSLGPQTQAGPVWPGARGQGSGVSPEGHVWGFLIRACLSLPGAGALPSAPAVVEGMQAPTVGTSREEQARPALADLGAPLHPPPISEQRFQLGDLGPEIEWVGGTLTGCYRECRLGRGLTRAAGQHTCSETSGGPWSSGRAPTPAPAPPHLLRRRLRILCTYSHSSRPTGSSRGRGRGAPYTSLHTAFSAKLRAAGWPSAAGARMAGLQAPPPAGWPAPRLGCWPWGCTGPGAPLPLAAPGWWAAEHPRSPGRSSGAPGAWGGSGGSRAAQGRGSAPSQGGPGREGPPGRPFRAGTQQGTEAVTSSATNCHPTRTLRPALGHGPHSAQRSPGPRWGMRGEGRVGAPGTGQPCKLGTPTPPPGPRGGTVGFPPGWVCARPGTQTEGSVDAGPTDGECGSGPPCSCAPSSLGAALGVSRPDPWRGAPSGTGGGARGRSGGRGAHRAQTRSPPPWFLPGSVPATGTPGSSSHLWPRRWWHSPGSVGRGPRRGEGCPRPATEAQSPLGPGCMPVRVEWR